MEDSLVNESINNDFLSQSYSQGIERIVGTKNGVFNFQIPRKLLEVREKIWDDLFDKYSREMSDDIELNVDTLEPEEGQNEEVVSEEEYSCGQRIPMRKPATLVQYWVNTGNPPYKMLLDETESSENGSSLSEKEIMPSLFSSISNVVYEGDEQERKSESSCSSVDTAAYILSNTNVTKKADTIAIIEGAKCININSSRDTYIKDIQVASSDKINYTETVRATNDMTCNNNNSNVNANTEFPMSAEYIASRIYDQPTIDTVISTNAVEPNVYLQSSSCVKTDKTNVKTNVLNTNQRSLNVQSIDDIASIFRQFTGTSKRLMEDGTNNNASNQNEMLEKDTSKEEKVVSAQQAIIARDTSMTVFPRKKLYTGRDSPVDLMLTERHSTSRLSGAKQSLHPALDSDSVIKRETFLVHKSKNKYLSPFGKRGLDFEKAKRKRRRGGKRSSILNKDSTDVNNKVTNNTHQIQDSIVNCSFNSLSDSYNNSNKRVDIPLQRYTNISVKGSEICRQNLASLNLNPIVILDRITPSFKQFESKSVVNNRNMHKRNIRNNRHLNKYEKLHICESLIDSDESTILICQCKVNASQYTSLSNDRSFNSTLNTEDGSSVSSAAEENGKVSCLMKNTSLKNISQNKELHVIFEKLPLSANKDYTNTAESQISNKNDTIRQEETLNKFKIHSNSYRVNKKDNVGLRDIKVVLERLPLSVKKNCTNTVVEMQVSNKNGTIKRQKKISNKTKAHYSNPHRTNKIDNVQLSEIKVILERLSPKIYLKGSNNVANPNTFAEEKKTNKQTTSLHNNKIESQINTNISKILSEQKGKVSVQTVCNNYLSKVHVKSKNIDAKTNDTCDTIVDYENQVIEEVKSNSTFQYENCNKVSHDNHNKHSVLTFTSSDEDDLVRLIKRPKKRSKMSGDDKTLDETNTVETNLFDKARLVIANKDKYHSGNPNTVKHSSRKVIPREIGSIKENRKQSEVEIKLFGNKTTTAPLHIRKNEKFLFFSSESDCDSATMNLDERKKRTTLLKCNKTVDNNNKSRLGKATKSNVLDYELDKDNVRVIFFQTKTFDSSDSEESNNYTCKALRDSPTRSRYYDHSNSEVFSNDFIAKRYNTKHSSSLNSSLEKHNVASRIRDIITESRSIGKEAKMSKYCMANEEFNENVNSKINDKKKGMSSFPFINNIRNASTQETTFLYTSISEENDVNILSEKEQNFDKSKNSVVIQRDNIKPAVKNLLTFQTKNYYDSDSNESL